MIETVLLSVLMFLAGVGVCLLALLFRRRYWRQQNAFKTQQASVWHIPPAIAQGIVRKLGDKKAAMLEQRLGKSVQFAAQYGEDILLAELFDYKTTGRFVEIGAFDGVFLSNTYFFEQIGWTGLLIEPLPEQYQACVRNRLNSRVVHAALGAADQDTIIIVQTMGQYPGTGETLQTHSFVSDERDPRAKRMRKNGAMLVTHTVPCLTFEEAAAKAKFLPETPLDFISIDCEGMDYEVLQLIDLEKWRPRLVVIEDVDKRVIIYMARHGYEAMLSTGNNTIFSRELADKDLLSVASYWRALEML